MLNRIYIFSLTFVLFTANIGCTQDQGTEVRVVSSEMTDFLEQSPGKQDDRSKDYTIDRNADFDEKYAGSSFAAAPPSTAKVQVEMPSNTSVSANKSSSPEPPLACLTGIHQDSRDLVEVVNATRLAQILAPNHNVTSRRTPAKCTIAFFFARHCPFSAMAAPHFNALQRIFPDITMVAVDVVKYDSYNTPYGIIGVPTLLLFHNGRPVGKFNDSQYTLEIFAQFIYKYTGLKAAMKLYVTSADFKGPVPCFTVKETDYCLGLAWGFIILCAIYYFSKLSWWSWFVEAIQNSWRVAEAHHEHFE